MKLMVGAPKLKMFVNMVLLNKSVFSIETGYRGSSIGLLDNAVIGYYCNSEFLDYLHLKYN